jgi:hypothetical protein
MRPKLIEDTQVVKDADSERHVPIIWRKTLKRISDAISERDFCLLRGIEGVCEVTPEIANAIERAVSNYGVHLTPLPQESWDSSVYLWMDGHWNVLIDLYSQEEGQSDLVLNVRVFELESGYSFEVQLVYVP